MEAEMPTLDELDQRVKALEDEMQKVQANRRGHEKRVNKSLDEIKKLIQNLAYDMDTKFKYVGTILSGQNERIDEIGAGLGKLETRFDGIESRFDKLETRFDNLDSRFDKLEAKVDKLPTLEDLKPYLRKLD
jgi:chromosome segregation ATPase